MTISRNFQEQLEMVREAQEFNYTDYSNRISEIKFKLIDLHKWHDKSLQAIDDMINETLEDL